MKKLKITITLLLFAGLSLANNPAIQIEKSGQGEPIVFLPGFTTPGSVWDNTIENLNGDYTAYKISYAGFNGIAPIDTPWYATVKNAINNWLEEQNLTDVTIIGHSMGGTLAIDLAAESSQRIKGIVLVDAIPCMREVMMPNVPAEHITYDNPYNNQLLNMNEDEFRKSATMICQNMTMDSSKIEQLISWSMNADRKTYVYGYTDLLKLDQRSVLSKINTHVLILGAGFPSVELVNTTYQNQFANLSSKTIRISAESKHFIMFDQPEWFYENINSFLSDDAK